MTSSVKYSLHLVTDTLWDVSDQGLPYSNISCIKFQNSLVWLLSILRRLFLEDPDETDFFSMFALCSPQLDFYSVILLGKPGLFTHSFPLFASFPHLLVEARCYKWKNHRFDIARKFIHWTLWQTICGKTKKFTVFVLSAGDFITISNILDCSSVHSGSGSTVNFYNLIMNRQSLTGRNVERFYSRKNQKVFFHLVNYGWVFTKADRELSKITIPLPWFLHLSIRNKLNIHG